MTDQQYASAESELLGRLQTMQANESGSRVVILTESIPAEKTALTRLMTNMINQYHLNTNRH
jgi:hypothetical protein